MQPSIAFDSFVNGLPDAFDIELSNALESVSSDVKEILQTTKDQITKNNAAYAIAFSDSDYQEAIRITQDTIRCLLIARAELKLLPPDKVAQAMRIIKPIMAVAAAIAITVYAGPISSGAMHALKILQVSPSIMQHITKDMLANSLKSSAFSSGFKAVKTAISTGSAKNPSLDANDPNLVNKNYKNAIEYVNVTISIYQEILANDRALMKTLGKVDATESFLFR